MADILILHGWGASSKSWARVKGLLEKAGYSAVVPDLPGFGDNPPPAKPYSIDDYVSWVKSFCEKQNLSQFFLLGHSFGGSIAIKYAIKFPGDIKKLILVDSAGIRTKTFKKEIFKKLAKILKKVYFLPLYPIERKLFYKLFARKSDYPQTEGVMKDTYLKTINEDISGIISGVSVKTLIIWGKKDDLTPIKNANFINQQIKGSQLEVLPKVRHNPQSESPGILTEKILNFIKP